MKLDGKSLARRLLSKGQHPLNLIYLYFIASECLRILNPGRPPDLYWLGWLWFLCFWAVLVWFLSRKQICRWWFPLLNSYSGMASSVLLVFILNNNVLIVAVHSLELQELYLTQIMCKGDEIASWLTVLLEGFRTGCSRPGRWWSPQIISQRNWSRRKQRCYSMQFLGVGNRFRVSGMAVAASPATWSGNLKEQCEKRNNWLQVFASIRWRAKCRGQHECLLADGKFPMINWIEPGIISDEFPPNTESGPLSLAQMMWNQLQRTNLKAPNLREAQSWMQNKAKKPSSSASRSMAKGNAGIENELSAIQTAWNAFGDASRRSRRWWGELKENWGDLWLRMDGIYEILNFDHCFRSSGLGPFF